MRAHSGSHTIASRRPPSSFNSSNYCSDGWSSPCKLTFSAATIGALVEVSLAIVLWLSLELNILVVLLSISILGGRLAT